MDSSFGYQRKLQSKKVILDCLVCVSPSYAKITVSWEYNASSQNQLKIANAIKFLHPCSFVDVWDDRDDYDD